MIEKVLQLVSQGFSQRKIASILGVSQPTISRIVNPFAAEITNARSRRKAKEKYHNDSGYNENRRRYKREQQRARREIDTHYRSQYNTWRRIWSKERRKNNLEFRLKSCLRTRLYNALRGNFRAGSAVRDLGCSIEFLKQHLETQFQPDMTWENYGEWHIDHIKPLSSFDLTDRPGTIS